MRHRSEIDGKSRGTETGRIAGHCRGGGLGNERLQGGQGALPVGLADQPEAQAGRHQIGGEGLEITDERIVDGNAGARRRRAERGRMTDSSASKPLTLPRLTARTPHPPRFTRRGFLPRRCVLPLPAYGERVGVRVCPSSEKRIAPGGEAGAAEGYALLARF